MSVRQDSQRTAQQRQGQARPLLPPLAYGTPVIQHLSAEQRLGELKKLKAGFAGQAQTAAFFGRQAQDTGPQLTARSRAAVVRSACQDIGRLGRLLLKALHQARLRSRELGGPRRMLPADAFFHLGRPLC